MHHAYSTRRHPSDRSRRFTNNQFADNEWDRDRHELQDDGPSNEYGEPAYERSNFGQYGQQGQQRFQQRYGRSDAGDFQGVGRSASRNVSNDYPTRENAGSIDEGYWRTAGQAYDSLYGSSFDQGTPQRSTYARVGMSPSLSDDDSQSMTASYLPGSFLNSGTGLYRGKGPKGYTRSDERLREMICELLSDAPHVDASEISVEVKNAEVTLSGSVDTRRTKHAVEDLIEHQTGAAEIHNNLRVQSGGFTSAVNRHLTDAWR